MNSKEQGMAAGAVVGVAAVLFGIRFYRNHKLRLDRYAPKKMVKRHLPDKLKGRVIAMPGRA